MAIERFDVLQRRIATVRDLAAVVRTMKALSGATIRQYERAAEAVEAYYRTVELGLCATLHSAAPARPAPRPAGSGVAAVVIGSDQGLCGRFNEIVVDRVVADLAELPEGPRRLLVVGARARARLEALRQPVAAELMVPGSVAAITGTVERLLLAIDDWRRHQRVHEVLLAYNAPVGRALYQPYCLRLLPVDLTRFRSFGEQPWPGRSLPYFTQERRRLLAALLRQYFFVILFRACADSLACEHAARLAAMQRADKNIAEHLQALKGQFQEQRQTAITEELLDIVAGAEALSVNT